MTFLIENANEHRLQFYIDHVLFIYQAPQPPHPWDGIRSATKCGPSCYQYDSIMKRIPSGSSEDCLYLNIYTPEIQPETLLPVMFYIHGGAFVSGNGSDKVYGPEFLVRHGVILVTFNYRLEALGFLCLDTEDVPGNAGMKDQVAALRWVNNNISNFGGDPENITIFGESAGGACVSYHLISPMSKGLFKRAIAQSGTANCWWSQSEQARERAVVLAKQLGFTSGDNIELYEFFKNVPLESLVKLNVPITASESAKTVGLAGIVNEKKFGNNEIFFSGNVYDLIRSNIDEGVEIIVGYTEDEGIFILNRGIEKIFEDINKFCDALVPKDIESNCQLSDRIEVSSKFRKIYFGDETPSIEQWEQLAKYYSFALFTYPIIQWAKVYASQRKNHVYFYKFTCKSERNKYVKLLGLTELIGEKEVVCHADDLAYLFPQKALKHKLERGSSTFQLIENFTKLWTNFAKCGYENLLVNLF